MVVPFGRELWDTQVRTGLEAARDVAALRGRAAKDARNNVIGSAGDDEEDALRRLADEPAFADLHPELATKVDEGRWIMTRILRAADALREELPLPASDLRVDDGPEGSPPVGRRARARPAPRRALHPAS